jgi:hypothetical protein
VVEELPVNTSPARGRPSTKQQEWSTGLLTCRCLGMQPQPQDSSGRENNGGDDEHDAGGSLHQPDHHNVSPSSSSSSSSSGDNNTTTSSSATASNGSNGSLTRRDETSRATGAEIGVVNAEDKEEEEDDKEEKESTTNGKNEEEGDRSKATGVAAVAVNVEEEKAEIESSTSGKNEEEGEQWVADDGHDVWQSFTTASSSSSAQDSFFAAGENVVGGEGEVLDVTRDESYDTAAQEDEEAVEPLLARSIAIGQINANSESDTTTTTTGGNDADDDDDDRDTSVDSDTAVNGRQTQRERSKIDHSVIYGTYTTADESLISTSGEQDGDDYGDENLLETSNNSSVRLPGFDGDEEHEIVFEEPASPNDSGVFGSSLWNIRPLSFDDAISEKDEEQKTPARDDEYQEDRGRFWFWRKKRPAGSTVPKGKRPTSIDPEPDRCRPSLPATTTATTTMPPMPNTVSPTRTVATDGTTSGRDTPHQRHHRGRRRRLFPRLASTQQYGTNNSDDSNPQLIEIITTDDDADDIERGGTRRSNPSRGSSHYMSHVTDHSRPDRSRSDKTKQRSNRTKRDGRLDDAARSNLPRTALFSAQPSPRHHSTPDRARSDHDRFDDEDPRATSNLSRSDPSLSPVGPASPDGVSPVRSSSPDVGSNGDELGLPAVVNGDDDDNDEEDHRDVRSRSRSRQRQSQYQLLTFYRLLCLACLFVTLIITSSIATAFLGAMMALQQSTDEDGDGSDESSPDPIQNRPTGAPVNGDDNDNNSTSVIAANPCDDASAWLELSLTFDARPAETSIVLRGAGLFETALWNFPEQSFRSFTQFHRTNVFGICLSRTSTYELIIGDRAANGLVSKLWVAGVTSTIYGHWEISLDGVQRAVYRGDCADDWPSSNNGTDTPYLLEQCGSYGQCQYSISSTANWTGGCNEDCY